RMPYPVSVGRAGIAILRDWIAGVAISVSAKERAAMLCLDAIAFGANIAALVIHVAIFEAKHDDHAFAVDKDIVAANGRILAVGAAAEKRAVEIFRDFAVNHFAI